MRKTKIICMSQRMQLVDPGDIVVITSGVPTERLIS